MNIHTVNLIGYRLRQYGYKNLKEYYLSKRWEKKKQEFKERMKASNFVFCYSCGIFNNYLQVHHKTYKSLCDEKLDQLCFFCSACHKKVHILSEKKGISIRIATKKLQRQKTGKQKLKAYRASIKIPYGSLKGIASKKKAHSCNDLNMYEPSVCKVIKPDGTEELLYFNGAKRKNKKVKKMNIPEKGFKYIKKKKVILKYTDEQLKKLIYSI